MATSKKTQKTTTDVEVPVLEQHVLRLHIIGTQPLFQNRMSKKVKEGLLVGSRKKTAAERLRIKHDPLQEFRDSAEVLAEPGPAALGIRTMAIKRALRSAAVDTPGAKGAQVDRSVFIPGDHFPLYGVPFLRMDPMRCKDINKTPDIRTRAFLPRWGAEIELHYVSPNLSAAAVVNLLCNAGVLVGIGDSRQEKGKGSFGSFRVVGADQHDPEWNELVKQGRDVQLAALKDPEFAGPDTAALMEFYQDEVKKRS